MLLPSPLISEHALTQGCCHASHSPAGVEPDNLLADKSSFFSGIPCQPGIGPDRPHVLQLNVFKLAMHEPVLQSPHSEGMVPCRTVRVQVSLEAQLVCTGALCPQEQAQTQFT